MLERKEGRKIKTLTIRLEDELHKKFKLYSIEKETDMQKILVDYIKEIVEEVEETKK